MKENDLFYISLEKMKALSSKVNWSQGCFGLEREALRVTGDGCLAMTPHPKAFGNKLENPWITTDFSESQVEVVTPVCDSVQKAHDTLQMLCDLVLDTIPEDESLWPQSMPCVIPEDEEIPVAVYEGDPEESAAAMAYRQGLIRKYGGSVQLLCGIHFNFSLPEETLRVLYEEIWGGALEGADQYRYFKDQVYLKMVRGYLRYRWLVILLTGCSSGYHDSFKSQKIPVATSGDEKGTCIQPFAVSVRNSASGYKNITPLFPRYGSVKELCEDVAGFVESGKISAPKEWYNQIRLKPKNVPELLYSLQEDGIQYLEIRTVDLDPLEPCGITEETMTFLHHFMLWLLTAPEATIDGWQQEALYNEEKVAIEGLKSDLQLLCDGQSISLKTWALSILEDILAMETALGLGGEAIIQKMILWVSKPEESHGGQLTIAVCEKGFISYHMGLAEQYKKAAQCRKTILAAYPPMRNESAEALKAAIIAGNREKVEMILKEIERGCP